MTNEFADVHALSGAYALDALQPAEALAFEQHLESCASCRDEVRSLREATGALADLAAETPPPSLRSSVLSGISSVRPLPPLASPDPVGSTPPVDDLADARARRTLRRASLWLGAAAAVLALVAGGAVVRGVQLDRRLDVASQQAAAVTAVLTAPDAKTITAGVATGGRAAVVTSASLGRSVLVTEGIAPAPDGRTYQIWYLPKSGAPVSAGFVPTGDHGAVVLEGDLSNASGVGVTVEPAGGSPAPTTSPVMVITV